MKGGGWGGLWIRGLAPETGDADCDSSPVLLLLLLIKGSFSG